MRHHKTLHLLTNFSKILIGALKNFNMSTRFKMAKRRNEHVASVFNMAVSAALKQYMQPSKKSGYNQILCTLVAERPVNDVQDVPRPKEVPNRIVFDGVVVFFHKFSHRRRGVPKCKMVEGELNS